MKLFISEPEERHQGAILIHDEALNDIAEFYHNEHATVDTSYETALALARKLTGAPAQPVAWRVKNDFGHWYVTQDKALADTYRDVEKKDVQPLYLASQPPTAPVESDTVPRSEMLEALANQRRRMGAEYDALDAELKRVRQVAKDEIGRLSRPPAPVETSTPAGMSRHDARSLVFDLLDAARGLEKADTASIRDACEYYDEMRDKVITALSTPRPEPQEPPVSELERDGIARLLFDKAMSGHAQWDEMTEPNKEDWRVKADEWVAAAPVETCLHALHVIGLDGKWRCQKCTAVIEMTTAQSNTGQ